MKNLKLTHLDKIFWPKEKITKGDLIEYYQKIAPYMLPYLKDRPVTLHRFPNGIEGSHFYQKNAPSSTPSWLKTAMIRKVRYLVVQDEESLLYLANLASIDIHPLHARIKNIEHPDYLIIDLDPEEIDFKHVVEVAQGVHEVLNQAGAESICKTSGGRGLHIYVPLKAKYSYPQIKAFAKLIAYLVHEKLPNITSLLRDPKKRKGKVYIDTLQNQKGATVASVYSVRPFPGAPVSTPLKWSEVNLKLDPQDFTIKTIFKRLQKVKDLFKPVLKEGIDLKSCLKRLEG